MSELRSADLLTEAAAAADVRAADSLFAGPGELAALMRARDWSQTPLGDSKSWPPALRTTLRILLTSRFSMWMGWGPELTFFYNDAYAPTLGAKHPGALGMRSEQVWSEIWGSIGPRIEHVLRTGEATWDASLQLFLERSGYPEETYHTFSYSPAPAGDGSVGGMLCVVIEETERVIGERRMALLRDLAASLANTQSDEQLFSAVEQVLGGGTKDIPFALAYLFEGAPPAEGETGAEPAAPPSLRARCVLRTGFPASAPQAPPFLEGKEGEPWPLFEALSRGEPWTIELDHTRWPRGPWEIPPRHALAIPISQQGQSRPAGVFIAGLNPYRALDDSFHDFLTLFTGQLAAGLANAHAYAEERRRAEELARLDRAKTAFFSNVSHELRTPLTLMLGPIAELLEEAPAGTSERETLSLVQRNGTRLLRLVNTLLEFSRIEAGRVQASYESVDLCQLTTDLASVFRSATDKAGLRFEVRCEPLGDKTYVDRDMWEKIVFNLISNAFKFTLEGGITISLARDGESAKLTVADTGSGIPRDELPRLFERFHRVEGTRGRTHEGTGIGLALVAELVKLHGGAVSAESEPGKGSAFTVTLPLGRNHLPPDRVRVSGDFTARQSASRYYVEEALRWLPGEPLRDTTEAPALALGMLAPIEPFHVLLADDNADMREYIRRLLGSRWSVDAVANGAEALVAVARKKPDLVITDVMMPLIDGFQLLDELRLSDKTRGIPVLMLSARAGDEARLEALERGVADYLVKPFAARELLARVDSLLLASRMRALEEEQARAFRETFEHAPVALAMLRGREHVFEYMNPAYAEIIGGREAVGKPIHAALPELDGQGIFELLDRVYATGEPFRSHSLRAALRRKGQLEECFFDMLYQPRSNASTGAIEGIAVVALEVTPLVRAQKAAESANRTKDEFLAMLGHELRNPLAPILTALHLMKLRNQGGEKERAIIERQSRHLVGLVDDLLDVARITRGQLVLRRSRIDLAEAIAAAIETASPLLEQNAHALHVDAPRGLIVDADLGRLAQVIANLLTNAAKYTPKGGQITVTSAARGGEALLSVRDSGMGIEPEMLSRIFEPFTQERQAIDRSQGGLGLGLAIVQSLVAQHGGRVSARSEGRGRGSEFVVTLPLAQGSFTPGPSSGRTAEAILRKRVLVVDDNDDAAETLSELLQAQGFTVRTAHDGPAALEAAMAFTPDLAIVDIGLPVMDGYELAMRLRDLPALRETRLIAVTGYGQEEDRARSAAAGFHSHLVKPVDPEKLRHVLE